MSAERLARVAFSRGSEPGCFAHGAAIEAAGGPLAAYDMLRQGWDVPGLEPVVCQEVRAVEAQRELDAAMAQGIRFVIPGDREWPAQLDDLAHVGPLHGRGGPVLGLWAKGPLGLDDVAPAVAIVGSRAASTYGREVAFELAVAAARAGFTVVSGAAYGIDVHAHRGALAAGGRTLAVLACGVDRAYPVGHRDVLEHLAATALVVSEVPIGGAPLRTRFLARNRIVVGLALGTVVVEAAVRSGALNSATWTEELSRRVMAVPGPVTSALSEGVNGLIRDRNAVLVTNGPDVCSILGRSGEHLMSVPRAEPAPRDALRAEQQQVLEAVPLRRPATTDSIAQVARMELRAARLHLERLAERGFVVQVETGWVQTGETRLRVG